MLPAFIWLAVIEFAFIWLASIVPVYIPVDVIFVSLGNDVPPKAPTRVPVLSNTSCMPASVSSGAGLQSVAFVPSSTLKSLNQ